MVGWLNRLCFAFILLAKIVTFQLLVREESSESESDFDDDMIEEDEEDFSEERTDQVYVRLKISIFGNLEKSEHRSIIAFRKYGKQSPDCLAITPTVLFSCYDTATVQIITEYFVKFKQI